MYAIIKGCVPIGVVANKERAEEYVKSNNNGPGNMYWFQRIEWLDQKDYKPLKKVESS